MELLLEKFDKYIAILAESQHDTYTSPFEIVTSDLGEFFFEYFIPPKNYATYITMYFYFDAFMDVIFIRYIL